MAREYVTREINKTVKQVSQKYLSEFKLTSYSFRSGYINQLWTNLETLELGREILIRIKD